MPSPVKRSSVPSWATTSRPISAWYSRRTPITSSGSAVSAKAVKPRRSRKTTVTSRRWLLSGSSASPATIISASCGEKKRLRRPRRSSWRDLLAHPRLERPVPVRELGGLLLDGVVELLDAEEGADAGQQLRLVHGLGQEVVGARLEPLDALLRRVERGHHHHRQDARGGIGADGAAHLVAAHLRHHHVEQHEVRPLRRPPSRAPRRPTPPSRRA